MTKEQFIALYEKLEEFFDSTETLESALGCYLENSPLCALAEYIPTFLNETFFHVREEDEDEYYQDFWDMVAYLNGMCPEDFYDKWDSSLRSESLNGDPSLKTFAPLRFS